MPFYNQLDPAFVPSVDTTSVGFGINTLASVTTGVHNTAIGNKVLTANTTGSSNVSVGGLTGSVITTGSDNTIIGHNAGSLITTGTNNVVVGKDVASVTLATGSNNILIGTTSAADAATASTSNTLWIGGGATAVLSATSINSTPVVTVPGSLIVTGGVTGTTTGIGSSVGGVASAFTNTGSTLATITGMSVTLAVGTYTLNGYLSVQAAATPGVKLAFLGGGAGASSTLIDTFVYSTSTLTAQSSISSLSSNLVSSAVTATAIEFTGTIVCTTAGTLTLQAAQAVSNATVLTVANNSYITATRLA